MYEFRYCAQFPYTVAHEGREWGGHVVRTCGKKASVSPRLGDEELLWDAELPKAEVTAFQSVIWSWIKGLDLVSGTALSRKQFLYMGQVVKIKSWTVCGQRSEGDKVGEI